MSKVFLGVGHGGSDPGAVGYLVEEDVNLTMALACRDYLEANGVEVKMSRTKDEEDPLTEVINECNAFNPDYAVDIHNNAGGGDGFEVFYGIAGVGKPLAENIEKEVKAIGQNSRGLKTKLNSAGNADYFGFIRQIKCPSIIVEGLFVDNKTDVQIGDTVEEQKAFGVAYAKGILKTLGITTQNSPEKKTEVETKDNNYLVKINTGVLNVRKQPNMDSDITAKVKKGEVYTIVEEKDGWGKLKSGAGWIKLQYTVKHNADVKPKPTTSNKNLAVGDKVKIKSSAKKYCTGQTIPNNVKGKKYTVKQIGTPKHPTGILLKEIYSWVERTDLEF